MSRKRTEINPKRAERVKQLIEEEGLTQTQFAESIFMSQQSVSRIVNQIMPLTEETAADIAFAFPKYSVEWLLGYSDYKNNTDAFMHSIQQMNEEGDLLSTAFQSLAALSGYNIKRIGLKTDSLESTISSLYDFVEIEHEGKVMSLSLEQLNTLENIIYEHAEITIKRYLEACGKEVQ